MSIFIDSLNSGFTANGGSNITYYFSNDYSNWNGHEIAQFENALSQWENVANITFTPAGSQSAADFVFYNTSEAEIRAALNVPASQGAPLGAFELPNGSTNQQESWFNYQSTGWDNGNTTGGLAQGGYGYITILHEVGHGLGLNHPHDGSPLFPGISGPSDAFSTGTNGYNQGIYTVMSYNDGLVSNGLNPGTTESYGWTGTPMAFDIAAIQSMYGANTSYQTGNNTYVLPSSNTVGTFYSSIWDAGGIDTIFADGNTGAVINLNAASLVNGDPDAGGAVSAINGIYGGFTIANGAVIENAIGGQGNDTITGNDVANTISGRDGDDTIDGGGGSDDIFGGNGNDTIYGGVGTDLINGQDGDDTIFGGDNGDELYGHTGNDTLYGGGASDIIKGHTGNDILYGGLAADFMFGEDDDDTLHGGAGNDILLGGSGNDTVNGDEDDDILFGQEGTDTLNGGSGDDLLASGTGNDTLNGDSGDDLMLGQAGDDLMNGGIGVDDMFGGSQNDTMFGGSQNDFLNGQSGDDIMRGDDGDDTLYGDIGNDNMRGGIGKDFINGGAGNDTMFGDNDDDRMFGEGGIDTMDGGSGNDLMLAGSGDDLLTGGSGDDSLYGQDGSDALDGGAGNDLLAGGSGVDTFVFIDGFGVDTISDFADDGLEAIDLTGVTGIVDYADLVANHVVVDGSGNVVIFDGTDTVTITNYTLGDMDLDDFIFI